MQKLMKRALCVLVCALLLAGLALPALAGEAGNSLTVSFKEGEKAFKDARFSLYRVADGRFKLVGDFEGCSADVSNTKQDNSEWLDVARQLKFYASSNGLTPLKAEKTDADGKASFTKLEDGLYLIVGAYYDVGRVRYCPTAYLLYLVNGAAEESLVKFDKWCLPDPPTPVPVPVPVRDTTEHKVLKVWDDNDNAAERPGSITIRLLRDGEVYDTVTLTAENGWRYSWDELPRYDNKGFEYDWSAQELPVNGYTVLVSDEGITSVITNTREMPAPEIEVEPELPNTGLLWWPVPVLFMAGLVLVAVGLAVRKKNKA